MKELRVVRRNVIFIPILFLLSPFVGFISCTAKAKNIGLQRNSLTVQNNKAMTDFVCERPVAALALGMLAVAVVMMLLFFIYFQKQKLEQIRQRKLQEGAAVIESAIKSINMYVWDYDIKEKVLTPNVISGIRIGGNYAIHDVPESMIKRGFVHPDSVDAYCKLFASIGKQEGCVQGDFLVRNAENESFYWVHILITPIYDEKGNLIKGLGTSVNITEKKEKECYYLKQLNAMLDARESNLMAKGRYNLTKNKKLFYEQYGEESLDLLEVHSYDEAVECLAKAMVSKKEGEEIRKKMSRESLLEAFTQGNTEGKINYKLCKSDGTIRWTTLSYTVLVDPSSKDVILFIYSHDVTQHIVESQIVNKLSQLEYEVVGVLDVRSKTYELKTIRSKIEGPVTMGKGDFEQRATERLPRILVPAELDTVPRLFKISNIVKQLEKKNSYYFTYSVYDDDRNIRRKKCQFCYLDDFNTTILYFRSDITYMYQKEQEQLRITEEALETAKSANSAKTEFFSRMSHDMRTPMNGILGLANLSKDENTVGELKTTIQKIEQSGEYLLGLINDTLDFQRIESGRMMIERENVKVGTFINNIVDMVHQTADQKGVLLRVINKNVDLDRYFHIDPLRMKQIFVNLLSNAIKFTQKDGIVEFSLESLEQRGMFSKSRVRVSDTGIGMSEEFLQHHIFQPFSQEKNEMTSEYAGSGLGLSIAKKLVDMMGGSIEVESKVGVGTVFTVEMELQCVEDTDVTNSTNENAIQKDLAKETLKGKRILLVEDHPLNAEIAMRLLEKAGCSVTWKENGRKGVDAFELADAFAFDVILMDIRMPVMTGLEAVEVIRASEKEDAKSIPIIAITANAYDEDVKLSYQVGMNDHVSKPIQPDVMYQKIASCIQNNK